ncbi:MAG: hypothetical protein HRU50_05840 [Winogradskyella sp.]|uniref:hypothetical protein n=1 Tax=Winogradskyella sp. TaxID=1883156 RepID=UPI0025F579A9|nr:hypothetical protein [Winogradskyella sp.]NRB59452.1 hypothetical protein [Winogradskyella sp.]
MSKIISIILSSIILAQSLQISVKDFLQIDELIEHANFHKQEYGDNFLVFLSKHYGELKLEHTHDNDNEKNEHEKLPFQCHGYSAVTFVFLQIKTHNFHLDIDFKTSFESNFFYLNLYTSLSHKRDLQPPKQA